MYKFHYNCELKYVKSKKAKYKKFKKIAHNLLNNYFNPLSFHQRNCDRPDFALEWEWEDCLSVFFALNRTSPIVYIYSLGQSYTVASKYPRSTNHAVTTFLLRHLKHYPFIFLPGGVSACDVGSLNNHFVTKDPACSSCLGPIHTEDGGREEKN